ncbi:receptor-like protein 7 [Pistacia vera]|uniref:receptor-like protein 7 n=1 Tax=Pistacia vera TaxID=55513 RepID=UPI001263B48F|nr:receptor-like protein 7 [Pistacia vera]
MVFMVKFLLCSELTALHEKDKDVVAASFDTFQNTAPSSNTFQNIASSDGPTPIEEGPSMKKEETIDVSWKNMSYTYKAVTLTLIYVIDLSCNNLTGKIPQIGNLTRIVTLNLSHNKLTGSIPKTFSNLKKIQSLDLSYNNLNGNIPPELLELNSLKIIYNHLLGPKNVLNPKMKTPSTKLKAHAQFRWGPNQSSADEVGSVCFPSSSPSGPRPSDPKTPSGLTINLEPTVAYELQCYLNSTKEVNHYPNSSKV